MTLYANTTMQIGCNLVLELRHSITSPDRPVIILSSGYGPSSLDKVLPLTIIELLELLDINWVQYIYPERDNRNPTTDLLISSGISTIRYIYGWLKTRGFSTIGLYGNSFGATISMETSMLEDVRCLILTNPVINFYDFRSKQLGTSAIKKWATDGYTIIKYPLGEVKSYYRFIEEAKHQCLSMRSANIPCDTIIFQGAKDSILSCPKAESLAHKIKKGRFYILPEGAHTINDEGSLYIVKQETINFLSNLNL